MKKENPPTLLVEMYTGIATMENSMEVPPKNKSSFHMIQKSHFWAYIQKKNNNCNSERYTYSFAHSSTIYKNQDIETI